MDTRLRSQIDRQPRARGKLVYEEYANTNFSTDLHGLKVHCMQDIDKGSRQVEKSTKGREGKQRDLFFF